MNKLKTLIEVLDRSELTHKEANVLIGAFGSLSEVKINELVFLLKDDLSIAKVLYDNFIKKHEALLSGDHEALDKVMKEELEILDNLE